MIFTKLKKHAGNPKFKELGERLEKIREKHEQGLLKLRNKPILKKRRTRRYPR